MFARCKVLLIGAVLAGATVPALAVDNLLLDPGFEGPPTGDGWGTWGNTGFHNFWGPDAHASLFADFAGNYGGVFQLAVAGLPETTYQFVLFNTRIESNWDADLYFGLEYYDVDDATKLGETMELVDTAARLANGQVDGNVLTMQGVTVPGTAFVRPVFRFDNVNGGYAAQPQASAFVFDTFLSVAPLAGDEFLKNPGFEDLNGDGTVGEYWGKWGNTGFNTFFGPNGHASFFADQAANSGGVYQQGILGTPGAQYRFQLSDVRVETNWDAELHFGLEYFGADDFNKLSETMVLADTSQPGDGLQFSMTGTAPPGTVYVRPLFRFDNVGTSGGSQRNLFVFGTTLTEVPGGCLGDCNCDGLVDFKDIDPFVARLGCPASNPAACSSGCTWQNADINGDSSVTFADIDPFVGRLGAVCP